MALELYNGETVIYEKEYAKGRKKSRASVTVTDKRFVSSVESKRGEEHTELKIEEVGGVSVRLRPASVILFAVGVLMGAADAVYLWYSNSELSAMQHSAGYMSGVTTAAMIIIAVYAVLMLVLGIVNLRHGFDVNVYTFNSCNDLISVSAVMGPVRPLKLRTNKIAANEIYENLSKAISEAKNK